MEPRWVVGLWLGKDEESDAHTVGTKDGTVIGRLVKPVAQDEVVANVFATMTWTPWRLSYSPTKVPGATCTGWRASRGSRERSKWLPTSSSAGPADMEEDVREEQGVPMEDDLQRGEKRKPE